VDKHLHIISLTVPYPVTYGGLFDIFYKLVALHRHGVKIHLHCFTTNNQTEPELNKYCESVHYYRRKEGWKGFSFSTPYVVSSRTSRELNEILQKDNYPILAEGIHCSALLFKKEFEKRRVILRLHNVEYRYYANLFSASSSFFKKMYFLAESLLLKKYETKLAAKLVIIVAVSAADAKLYRDEFHAKEVNTLPVFIGNKMVTAKTGTGNYCLYHGNLAIAENELAVCWLLDEVIDDQISFIVAGKNPTAALQKKIKSLKHCALIADPSHEELAELIENAQCHLLPSFNSTGVKLKLINALFAGRHCIVNPATVTGTSLQTACIVANDGQAFREAIREYRNIPFTEQDVRSRKSLLERMYNDDENCRQLIQWIW
jgi:glycosyltransferase involved in cell wall biosynthesis